MSLRLFSLYDSAVGVFLRPFWSDHKANALRSVTQLVNDTSDPHNNVANHPDQFTLFQIGVFDEETGSFVADLPVLSIVNCLELKAAPSPKAYRPELHQASGT